MNGYKLLLFTLCIERFVLFYLRRKEGMKRNCYSGKKSTMISLWTFFREFSPVQLIQNPEKTARGSLEFSGTQFSALKVFVYVVERPVFTTIASTGVISTAKDYKRAFENNGCGPLAKCGYNPEETESVRSTNAGFPTQNHCAINYEQTEKDESKNRRYSYRSVKPLTYLSYYNGKPVRWLLCNLLHSLKWI